jgi:hypothetical protein
LVRHCGRFASANVVGFLLTLLGKGVIVASSGWITQIIIQSQIKTVQNPYVPAIVIAGVAWLVSSLFLSVWDFASLGILHSFIMDEDMTGGANSPDCLKDYIELNDR